MKNDRLLEQYVDILTSRGIDEGLLGPRELPRIWERHITNSLAVSSLIPDGDDVADVGSGAGLPGLPLAIERSDLRVTLIEPLLRRSTFLTETVAALGLGDRVHVVRGRAEDLTAHRSRFDTVTARAVAPLGRLIEWCWPLVTTGGQLIAMKGRTVAAEVERDAGALTARQLTASIIECAGSGHDVTYAVVIRADRR